MAYLSSVLRGHVIAYPERRITGGHVTAYPEPCSTGAMQWPIQNYVLPGGYAMAYPEPCCTDVWPYGSASAIILKNVV